MDLTKRQREILLHAIGNGHRNMNGKLYRNHYCVNLGSDVEGDIGRLLELKLMRRGGAINEGRGYYVHATKAGISLVCGER